MAGQDSGGTVPVGWHPDPWGQAPYRWWDGTRWTEHTTTDLDRPKPKRPVGLIVVGVIVAVAALGMALEAAVTGDDDPPAAAEDSGSDVPREGDDGTAARAFAASIDGRDYQWVDRIADDGQLNVIVEGEDAATVEALRRRVEADAAAAFAAAFHDPGTDAERVLVRVEVPLTDQYGNTNPEAMLEVVLDADTAERVNWDDPDAIRWPEVWVEVHRHPELGG